MCFSAHLVLAFHAFKCMQLVKSALVLVLNLPVMAKSRDTQRFVMKRKE